ncbi:MAG: ATP-binding protein [Kiritimatiellae bacterium]|nr:ATP-binding protein [Kiritimatiellia bacterium]
MNEPMKRSSDAQYLATIFQQSPDGIVLQDPGGTIIETNASFCKLCNQPPEKIIGKKFADMLCPASRTQWDHDLAKLLKNEWSEIDEICIFTDGHKIPVEVGLIAKTAYGGRDAVILHVRNVSVYHTVENALLASQNQWELCFNSISDKMLILNRQGCILRANQAALQKITPLAAEPVGAVFFDIFRTKNPAGQIQELRAKMYAAPCALAEIEFEKLPGKYSFFSYPIISGNDKNSGCIVIIKDITEQCRQAELLKKAEARRQRTNRIETLGRMVGGIAHDFNNILTTLLGYVSLVLQSETLGQNERISLTEIMRTVERGTALTRQLFDFSSEKKPDLKIINLNAVIQNMQKMLIQLLGPNITIAARLDQQLWNTNADVSRLERIIANFAANARDAMPAGGEFVIETGNTILDANFCRTHPELKPGNYVLLQVSDTGTGMPPAVLERIFEPFFTTKKNAKGLGLGLSSVFGIVRQFGGEIICYSEVGRGTTFKVYLPQSTEKAYEEPQNAADSNLPGGPETVFIVDDEIHITSMLSQILSKIGYKVLTATTSSKAIALCRKHKGNIDIILSDIIMPDMNGVELLATLRETRPELKAIFMSGYTSSMAVESTGMDKNTVFLQKPFTFEELARKIRSSLDADKA